MKPKNESYRLNKHTKKKQSVALYSKRFRMAYFLSITVNYMCIRTGKPYKNIMRLMGYFEHPLNVN
jgi:hypothetical protein